MVDHEETLSVGDISETLWRWGVGVVVNDTYFWGLVNMHYVGRIIMRWCDWRGHDETMILGGSS